MKRLVQAVLLSGLVTLLVSIVPTALLSFFPAAGDTPLLTPAPAGRGARGEVAVAVDLNDPPRLDVNVPFADSCLVDFSFRLSPPAGQQGFLFVGTDGHFYFEDGTRTRFWGINVAKDAVFQPHNVIDRSAAVFARAGLNLVRLHHLDDVGGLLPPGRAGRKPRIDPEKRDAVDYWIAALKRRGIYVYLDLLDYRTFWEPEGVINGEALGRGAKPYALFNERLIELQREYARELLVDHVNPYTGLSYAQDPAVVMLELCDENGLLARQKDWRQMVSPYREELLRRWNFWLRSRYRTTQQLKEAWGANALAGFEDLEQGEVALPGISPQVPNPEARAADVRRFAASLHRDYFTQMRDFLRAVGVQVPLTAVTDTEYPADLFAVAAELDFIGTNYYFAHPVTKASQPSDVLAFFEAGSPLTAAGFDTAIRRLCGPRVAGKPLVIREWNVCWPNEYRPAGMLEAAAFAARQDIDGMILFTYNCRPGPRKLSYFDVAADPTRWGLVALAGEVFRNTRLQSPQRLTVAFSEQDVYDSPDETLVDGVYEAGREVQMANWFPDCGPAPTDWLYLRPHAQQIPDLILPQLASSRELRFITDRDITKEPGTDLLTFGSPTVQGMAGELANSLSARTPHLRIRAATDQGAVVWCSLDEQPPAASRRWIVKMVSAAENTGQQTREHFVTDHQQMYALAAAGTEPVITRGWPSAVTTRLNLAGTEIVRVYQRGGTWELVRARDDWFFYTDTAGIRFELPILPSLVRFTVVTAAGTSSQIVSQPLVYPDKAILVKISAAEEGESADE